MLKTNKLRKVPRPWRRTVNKCSVLNRINAPASRLALAAALAFICLPPPPSPETQRFPRTGSPGWALTAPVLGDSLPPWSEKNTVPGVKCTGRCRRPRASDLNKSVSPSRARGLLPSASSRHSKQRAWRHAQAGRLHRLNPQSHKHSKVHHQHKHNNNNNWELTVYWHVSSCAAHFLITEIHQKCRNQNLVCTVLIKSIKSNKMVLAPHISHSSGHALNTLRH